MILAGQEAERKKDIPGRKGKTKHSYVRKSRLRTVT